MNKNAVATVQIIGAIILMLIVVFGLSDWGQRQLKNAGEFTSSYVPSKSLDERCLAQGESSISKLAESGLSSLISSRKRFENDRDQDGRPDDCDWCVCADTWRDGRTTRFVCSNLRRSPVAALDKGGSDSDGDFLPDVCDRNMNKKEKISIESFYPGTCKQWLDDAKTQQGSLLVDEPSGLLQCDLDYGRHVRGMTIAATELNRHLNFPSSPGSG